MSRCKPVSELKDSLINAEYFCSNGTCVVFSIDEGLRRVEPYWHVYRTNVKERWRGMKLLDVFVSEYRDREPCYYEQAISSGFITVNGKKSTADSVVLNGDVIEHKVHRHEPAVPDKIIGTVYEDGDYLVIDKPSGIPVHAAGRFRHNTILHILSKEYVDKRIYPCNRLDRLSSGLMFLAFSATAAERMRVNLSTRVIFKKYLCRVIGLFPDTAECCEPLMTIDPKLGLVRVHPDGKAATTGFTRVNFDGKSSLVLCKPLTGRTHQIRVHLQWLGHPISNDPLYADPWVWGTELGKFGAGNNAEVINRLSQVGKTRAAFSRGGEQWSGKKCTECETPLYTDPSVEELQLYLHAWEYRAQDGSWCFRAPLPSWVKVEESVLE